jgi:hypothetical protein
VVEVFGIVKEILVEIGSRLGVAPAGPCGPVAPAAPAAPSAPLGIVKSNLTSDDVPELLTRALVPGALVVVELTRIVAAASPLRPVDPVDPVAPVGPIIDVPDGHAPEAFGPNIVLVVVLI